jgi:hypothetical protein
MWIRTAVATIALALSPLAAHAESLGCGATNPFATSDDLSGIWSPCAVAPGSLVAEAVYFQNASAVGGTALAAYPLVRLRTGILPRFELVVDTPSQIAESRRGGGGLYPLTLPGYGFGYTLAQSANGAIGILAQVAPPTSRFAPAQTQPHYMLSATSAYRISRRSTLGAFVSGVSSGRAGFTQILPTLAVRGGFDASAATELTTDLGTRLVTRRGVAQSFGDIGVNQRLHGNLLFTVGVGTSFNAVSNAKAHYLASGFTYRVH